MRAHKSLPGLTALAVAGNRVVLLGWDMPADLLRSQGVLGFAVRRLRHEDGERTWLAGFKTFQSVAPNPIPGEPVSSFRHPLQTFQWADYSVEPNKTYTYKIVAMTGSPDALVQGAGVVLRVTTERTDLGKHAVFFNRGAVGSQEYARRFQNRLPAEVGSLPTTGCHAGWSRAWSVSSPRRARATSCWVRSSNSRTAVSTPP